MKPPWIPDGIRRIFDESQDEENINRYEDIFSQGYPGKFKKEIAHSPRESSSS